MKPNVPTSVCIRLLGLIELNRGQNKQAEILKRIAEKMEDENA